MALTHEAAHTDTKLSKISGNISHYKKSWEMANFFFTDRDRNIMGLSAIAGALAGAAGIEASTARDAANLREQADYVEMEVNGHPAKGWVWFSPFKDGDEVEIIGTQQNDYFEIIAVTRPKDKVIALYPHCSRGKTAHIKTVFKWWFLSVSFLAAILAPLVFGFFDFISGKDEIFSLIDFDYIYVCAAVYAIFGTYAYVTGKKIYDVCTCSNTYF